MSDAVNQLRDRVVELDVRNRERFKADEASELAEEYGVTTATIRMIARGVTWI